MPEPPNLRSMNVSVDSEVRPVLCPAGNKTRTMVARKPSRKQVKKEEKTEISPLSADKGATTVPVMPPADSASISSLKRPGRVAYLGPARAANVLWGNETSHSNLSLNTSCSSDASTDSGGSRASTEKTVSRRNASVVSRRKQGTGIKPGRVVPDGVVDASMPPPSLVIQFRKRCAWVTGNTDPCYATFHDEEWGVPVHDDNKLFEYLSLSGALSELTWPSILSKRHVFREVFFDFEPALVAKLNEKKVIAPGSIGSSLLSELKLRSIIDNARRILKIVEEFGSFGSYCWSFVSGKPIVNSFRYPRQVPVKTPKAEVISKDMVQRGLRSVSPTVIYTFMQVAGLTNDHLVSCYRFSKCMAAKEERTAISKADMKHEHEKSEVGNLTLAKAVEDLSLSSLCMKTNSSNGSCVAVV